MKSKLKQTQSLQFEPKLLAAKSKANFDREERSKSTESQKGRTRSVVEKQGIDFSNKPSPLDFDAFLPWICIEWECLKKVSVIKTTQEVYKKKEKRNSSSRSRSSKLLKPKGDETDTRKSKDSRISVDEKRNIASDKKNTVVVKTVYDVKGYLVEVAITEAKDIPLKIMRGIAVCIPFHSLFTRLTIQRGGVSSLLLHDIARFLPTSNITDVHLEHCFVPQGNYYVLLNQISQLRNLLLRHCHINDEVCDQLVSRIEHGGPGSSLLILDLGSNSITDVGAKRIGQVLRMNRTLLHLNLSNNKITDVGATAILSALSEFRLTMDETIALKQRKFEHARAKAAIFKKCFEEIFRRTQRRDMESNNDKKSVPKLKSINKKEKLPLKPIKLNRMSEFHSEKTATEAAERMMRDIVGDFVDPFDSKRAKIKNEFYYGVGNLSLCSLNLAYNMFTLSTITMIYEVLKYQNQVPKTKPETGLIRIVFEGNRIPVDCIEYRKIEDLLINVINSNVLINSPLSARRIKTSK